jgi:hypothetical protein
MAWATTVVDNRNSLMGDVILEHNYRINCRVSRKSEKDSLQQIVADPRRSELQGNLGQSVS